MGTARREHDRSGSLLFVGRQGADPSGSEELRYLVEMDLAEADAVFERVVPIDPEELSGALGTTDWVLLQDLDPLFVGRTSLRAMRDSDAGAVVPQRLDRLEPGPEVHTLREYELVEREWLARDCPAAAPAAVPALLTRTARLTEPAARAALDAWLARHADLGALASALGAASAGLCHCFVDYYGSVREDVLPLLPDGALAVLEVGCGRGFTGAMLQRELGCHVTGVELNEQIANDARSRLHEVVHGDILTAEINGRFDAAILFDVLEHVTRGEALLRRVASLVRPGGVLLLSIPNVGHYSIVRDLLAGRWDYVPMGLLCYTHVRFFTRRTLEDWLLRCGFESFDILPRLTPLPPEIEELPEALEVDRESLRTHGFHVLVRVASR